jgi:hypothetical protein
MTSRGWYATRSGQVWCHQTTSVPPSHNLNLSDLYPYLFQVFFHQISDLFPIVCVTVQMYTGI